MITYRSTKVNGVRMEVARFSTNEDTHYVIAFKRKQPSISWKDLGIEEVY